MLRTGFTQFCKNIPPCERCVPDIELGVFAVPQAKALVMFAVMTR